MTATLSSVREITFFSLTRWQATSDLLMGSDWGVNMELVDLVNLDVHTCGPGA